MTVTPANLDQVPHVVRSAAAAGFAMLSFQPAAFLGDDRRWHEDYRAHDRRRGVVADRGRGRGAAGLRTCSRTATSAATGPPTGCSSVTGGSRCSTSTTRATRPCATPSSASSGRSASPARPARSAPPASRGWSPRTPASCRSRSGGRTGSCAAPAARAVARAAVRGRVRPLTFVMHQFMDAADVAPAWEATQRGEWSARPPRPRHPGTPRRLPLRDGPPRGRDPGPRLRPARPARPRREPGPPRLLPITDTTSRHRGRVADAGSEET